jgi:hypothetical protein
VYSALLRNLTTAWFTNPGECQIELRLAIGEWARKEKHGATPDKQNKGKGRFPLVERPAELLALTWTIPHPGAGWEGQMVPNLSALQLMIFHQ